MRAGTLAGDVGEAKDELCHVESSAAVAVQEEGVGQGVQQAARGELTSQAATGHVIANKYTLVSTHERVVVSAKPCAIGRIPTAVQPPSAVTRRH